MPDRIIHKRNLTPGTLPTTASLEIGELAINVGDGKIHLRRSGSGNNDVVSLVTANTVTTGSIQATAGFTGSLFGTASWANNFTETDPIFVARSGSFVTTSSFGQFTSSIQNQVNSLTNATSSYVLNSQTSSMTVLSSSYADNLRGFVPSDFAKLTGGNSFTGTQTITGNLNVIGTASFVYTTASQLDISTNIISVNTNAAVRFGGLAVIDSGSIPRVSGSLLFDSQNNQWIFVHQDGNGAVTSSVLIMGPQTFNDIGNETTITVNKLTKGTGGDLGEHIGDSNITDTGTLVSINSNTQVTGSLLVTGGITGSLQGTASSAISSSYADTVQSAPLYVLSSVTSSMLEPYVLNSVTSSMLNPYVLSSVTSSMLQPYVLSSATSSFVQNSVTASMLEPYVLTSVTSSMTVLSSSFATTASFMSASAIISSLGYTPVNPTRSISTTSPLSGGGNLSADRTISIADAAADGSTKGAATFTANDFDSLAGVISLDYTNGQKASASVPGFLTAANWSTFNGKQDNIIKLVKAGSDQTTTSNTAQNDTELTTSAMEANKTYAIYGRLRFGNNGAGGGRLGWNLPSGATGNTAFFGATSSATTFQYGGSNNGLLSTVQFTQNLATQNIFFMGSFTMGSTTGTANLIFASQTSGQTTTISGNGNSFLILVKLD